MFKLMTLRGGITVVLVIITSFYGEVGSKELTPHSTNHFQFEKRGRKKSKKVDRYYKNGKL